MASMSMEKTSYSSSLSSSTSQWKYDVFLSFRGVDTRKGFTSHLYAALEERGIHTFKDDKELEAGKYISSELLNAIEESKFAIVILSEDYTSSTWCLVELEKIISCSNKTGMIVLPVFYNVDPSDIRKNTKKIGQALAKHEERFKENIVQTWRDALTKVANLKGWHLQDRPEAELIQEIVKVILNNQSYTFSVDTKELVGINFRVEKLKSLLAIAPDNVRIIGIWGTGGMGKTTLARVVYEMVSNQFEACSFIGNIREFSEKYGLHKLQEKLLNELLMHRDIKVKDVDNGAHMIKTRLCHKKILLVLDDVHDLDQLNKLVGEHWFGRGSRVIITTRDAHLLKHKVDGTYEVEGLNYDEAFQLFNLKAFKQEHPNEDFLELSQAYVHYANGLPLAIDILGSFLLGRSKDEWKSELDRLKEFPERKILDTLKISFNGLAEIEKEIFLYIACFFNHTNQDTIIEILDYLGLYPKIGLSVLKDKSLIKCQDNHLLMHDLFQEMGRNIVHQESPNNPGERSRLWLCKDIDNVLTKNTGTKKIQGIVLHPCGSHSKGANWNPESFSKMPCLKLLKIDGVHLMHDLKHLPESLRFLDWSKYPLKTLPSNFQSNELVKLCLNHSYTEKLWEGKKTFNKLKYIQVNWSKKLRETPDFTEVPVLEKLDLEGCINLSKIHPSTSVLKELTLLNLRDCINLTRLPNKFEMKSLEILILSGCLKVKRIPEFGENMDRVSELYLDDTAITKLPISIGNLTRLASLSIRDCKNLMSLPSTMFNIRSLKCLDFSGCPKLCNLLENLETVESNTSGTTIRLVPSFNFLFKTLEKLVVDGLKPRGPNPMNLSWTSLSGLTSLTKLKLENCNLREISNDIGCLSSLKEINLCGNSFVYIPESIGELSNLTWMELDNCTKLRSLPKLPLNIDYIRGFGCTSLETVPDLLKPNSSCEPRLYLSGCSKLAHNRIDIFLARIKKHLQGLTLDDRYDTLHLEMRYDIIIPGSEIPEWFKHQNIGAKVNIVEPSHLCNEWMGIAVCAIFCSQRSQRNFRGPRNYQRSQRNFRGLRNYQHCQRAFGGPIGCSLIAKGSRISYVLGYNNLDVLSDHIWLLYLLPQFFTEEDIKLLWKCDANGFSHIGVDFETYGLDIKKCGMHMVYKKDIENLNQTMAQNSNTSIIPYGDLGVFHHKFDNSTMEVEGNKEKFIHGDYDGARLGGEGSSNDTLHPKRIKTLIEFVDLGNSDCEEPSEYKECREELSDWEGSSESDREVIFVRLRLLDLFARRKCHMARRQRRLVTSAIERFTVLPSCFWEVHYSKKID